MTLESLSHFILSHLKSEDDGRVALYHFLKNFGNRGPDAPLTPDVINAFYFESMQVAHWRKNKKELHRDVKDVLQKFIAQNHQGQASRSAQTTQPTPMAQTITPSFRWDQLLDLERIQIVELESADTLYQILKNQEQSQLQEGENFRIIINSMALDGTPQNQSNGQATGPHQALVIKKNRQGEVDVRIFSNIVRIGTLTTSPGTPNNNVQLLPLPPIQYLSYDASLELKTNTWHMLRPTPHTLIRFIHQGSVISGYMLAGYAFREAQSFQINDIAEDPRILVPLKKLERYFIQRASDPYYVSVLSSLDEALNKLQIAGVSGGQAASDFAMQAFDHGQMAFDQIFSDDKALYMRLKELAHWISN